MNSKLKELAERRKRLIEQADKQRMVLAQEAVPWRIVMARVDHGLAALRYLKTHPAWVVGGAAFLIFAVGPGRVWRWIGRGLLAWRTMSQFLIR